MLLIGQFILIFILIESANTRFELFNYKWNVHALRLMVSIPIYMSIYGTLLLIQQLIFIVITDLDLVEIFIVLFNSILMAPIVYSIFKTSLSFSIASNNTTSRGITCMYLCPLLDHAWKNDLFSDWTRATPLLAH